MRITGIGFGESALEMTQGTSPQGGECRLDGIRIWVVEDDPEWRDMVVDELTYHGAIVRGIESV